MALKAYHVNFAAFGKHIAYLFAIFFAAVVVVYRKHCGFRKKFFGNFKCVAGIVARHNAVFQTHAYFFAFPQCARFIIFAAFIYYVPTVDRIGVFGGNLPNSSVGSLSHFCSVVSEKRFGILSGHLFKIFIDIQRLM